MFSHVTPDDVQGDRVYKCYAYNSIRRKGIYGSYHKIKVTGKKSISFWFLYFLQNVGKHSVGARF